MTAALPRLATGMNEGPDASVLGSIAMPGIAVAAWHRSFPEVSQAWLDGLPLDQLPRMHRVLPAGQVQRAVSDAWEQVGIFPERLPDGLLDDIGAMAELIATVLASPMLEMRLGALEDQRCPRWQLGSVSGRLVCALRGSGVEFGPARPNGLPSTIHALPTGTAALFRGLLWPGHELSGIIHRVPPALGETRLLLILDSVDDAGAC